MRFLTILIFFYFFNTAYSQTDTVFWFVAPEVVQSHGDDPIFFRLSSYQDSALVTISQPSNNNFTPQTIKLNAYSNHSINLTQWKSEIENQPHDSILNYGFLIQSTSNISIYYEVNRFNNPDIFSLKGKNALGKEFYTPFQTYLTSGGNLPNTAQAIDIVATEDSTEITIYLNNPIIGHLNDSVVKIVLNRGQTYSAKATGLDPNHHLSGTKIISSKPIAITISHDTMNGTPFGGCADLGGDQIVPTSIIGKEYIAMDGFLNGAGDQFFVLAVEDSTIIEVNGQVEDTLMQGETVQYPLSKATYVKASKKIYLLQLSGFGCEVGLSLLPPVNCTGSNEVTIVRSTNEPLFLNILVRKGFENTFVFNGDSTFLQASQFDTVSATNGSWLYSQIQISNALIPQGGLINLNNYSGVFHCGIIHGGSSSGTRFGYFSGYAGIKPNARASSEIYCKGDTVKLFSDAYNNVNYSWVGPNFFSSNTINPVISNFSKKNAGKYFLSITFDICKATDSVHIGNSNFSVGDTLFNYCLNDTAVLSLKKNNGVDWSGPNNFTSQNSIIEVPLKDDFSFGKYSAEVIDTNNCSHKFGFYLTEKVVNLILNVSDTLGFGELNTTISVESRGFNLFNWQFGNDSTVTTPNKTYTINIKDFGLYQISISAFSTNDKYCHASENITLKVVEPQKISIPNIITPNNDDFNDALDLNFMGYELVFVEIYNRWGETIFSSNNANEWQPNENISDGVYFYFLELKNIQYNLIEEYKGSITIIK